MASSNIDWRERYQVQREDLKRAVSRIFDLQDALREALDYLETIDEPESEPLVNWRRVLEGTR